MKHRPPAWTLLCIPVAVGSLVMSLGGAPAARWAAHIAAGALGVLAYAAASRVRRASFTVLLSAAVAGTVAVLATLAVPGLQGVHRWLVVGPLRLHASALVMPALLVFVASYLRHSPTTAHLLLLAVQVLHLAQPDAGQATAVAAASVVILMTGSRSNASRACAGGVVAVAAATWLRADPLSAAPFVEDIVGRAFDIAPWTGCLALVSLAAGVLAPRAERGPSTSSAAKSAEVALTAYLATAILVAAIGEFPVPLLGFGASPVLGAFLGLAALRRLGEAGERARPSEASG